MPSAFGLAAGCALRFVVAIIGVDEELFHLLPEKWIASAGPFHKDGPPKRIITFDGLGQDRLHAANVPESFGRVTKVGGEHNSFEGASPRPQRILGSSKTGMPELVRLLLLDLHIQFRDADDVACIEVDGGLEGPISLAWHTPGAAGDVFGALDVCVSDAPRVPSKWIVPVYWVVSIPLLPEILTVPVTTTFFPSLLTLTTVLSWWRGPLSLKAPASAVVPSMVVGPVKYSSKLMRRNLPSLSLSSCRSSPARTAPAPSEKQTRTDATVIPKFRSLVFFIFDWLLRCFGCWRSFATRAIDRFNELTQERGRKRSHLNLWNAD